MSRLPDDNSNAPSGNSSSGTTPSSLPTNPLEDLRLRRPPFWMIALFLILVVVSWIPLVVAARRRVSTSESPRISLLQDMGNQPKYKAQHTSPVFADERADRPAVAGTVSRESLSNDDFFFRGYAAQNGKPQFFDGFPKDVVVDQKLLERGQQRYNIYCAACHGYDGHGHGAVNERALELQGSGMPGMSWTQAADLHSDQVKARPNGHLFNTITNGIRAMGGYGGQIAPADRWAIIAYVRALQLSQDAPQNVASATEAK
jgi:mono/diheme cytochrome c family protein